MRGVVPESDAPLIRSEKELSSYISFWPQLFQDPSLVHAFSTRERRVENVRCSCYVGGRFSLRRATSECIGKMPCRRGHDFTGMRKAKLISC